MAIAYTDRDALRKTLREINLKDYRKSENVDFLNEELPNDPYGSKTVSEDRLLDVIQYLKSPSGRGGMTNMEYYCEHKKGSYKEMDNMRGYANARGNLNEEFIREKMNFETEMGSYRSSKEYDNPRINETPKKKLDEIKARYIDAMGELTKKFQEEINNLQ
jgi:hypothetical protein